MTSLSARAAGVPGAVTQLDVLAAELAGQYGRPAGGATGPPSPSARPEPGSASAQRVPLHPAPARRHLVLPAARGAQPIASAAGEAAAIITGSLHAAGW
jgi:hypothetical protein